MPTANPRQPLLDSGTCLQRGSGTPDTSGPANIFVSRCWTRMFAGRGTKMPRTTNSQQPSPAIAGLGCLLVERPRDINKGSNRHTSVLESSMENTKEREFAIVATEGRACRYSANVIYPPHAPALQSLRAWDKLATTVRGLSGAGRTESIPLPSCAS
jgi:hypothetical protein